MYGKQFGQRILIVTLAFLISAVAANGQSPGTKRGKTTKKRVGIVSVRESYVPTPCGRMRENSPSLEGLISGFSVPGNPDDYELKDPPPPPAAAPGSSRDSSKTEADSASAGIAKNNASSEPDETKAEVSNSPFNTPAKSILRDIEIPHLKMRLTVPGDSTRTVYFYDSARVETMIANCGPLETKIQVIEFPNDLGMDSGSSEAKELLNSWLMRDRYKERFKPSTKLVNGVSFHTFRSLEFGWAEHVNAAVVGNKMVWIASKLKLTFLESEWNERLEKQFIGENDRLLESFQIEKRADLPDDQIGAEPKASTGPRFRTHEKDVYDKKTGVLNSPDAGISAWFPSEPERVHDVFVNANIGLDLFRFSREGQDASSFVLQAYEYPVALNVEKALNVVVETESENLRFFGMNDIKVKPEDCEESSCVEISAYGKEYKMKSFVRITDSRVFIQRVVATNIVVKSKNSLFNNFEKTTRRYFDSFKVTKSFEPANGPQKMPFERPVSVDQGSVSISFDSSSLIIDIPKGFRVIHKGLNEPHKNEITKMLMDNGYTYSGAQLEASKSFLHFLIVDSFGSDPSYFQLFTGLHPHPAATLKDVVEITKRYFGKTTENKNGDEGTMILGGIEFIWFDHFDPQDDVKKRFMIGRKDDFTVTIACRFVDLESELKIMTALKAMRSLPISLRNGIVGASQNPNRDGSRFASGLGEH
ncbi:MAG: hypothetical protein R2684_07120 [Pyrinomonadaceae bacterium]